MADTEDQMDKFIADSDDPDAPPKSEKEKESQFTPQYRMMTEEIIPVSKKMGRLWQSRKKQAMATLKHGGELDRWDACLRYYRNDQAERTPRDKDDSTTQGRNPTLTSEGKETENLVFANASSLVPAVYAKNPSVEVTCEDETNKEFCETCEHLANVLFRRKTSPGINLKPTARRATLMSTLTNYAFVEVGYTFKEQSSEDTLTQINDIAVKLQKAKKREEIEELEGQLMALDDKVDMLKPSGPWAKFRTASDVLFDSDACTIPEAQWMMIRDYIPTSYLRAMYATEKEDTEEYKSVYKPSHVMKLADDDDKGNPEGDLNDFSLFSFDTDKKAGDYGYDDDTSFEKAKRTMCWWVWDRATQRVYLFNNADWKWPIWVWNDPYKLDTFFPIELLEFYTDPENMYARSETLYYLDQQDGINSINNEMSKVRDFAIGKAIYNSRVIKDEKVIDNFLAGTTRKRMLGIDADPNTDLTKLFSPFVPQTAHLLETVIFNKQRLLESIDRVSSVTSVMRGVEYKTNTTNKAIESYESNTQTRLDEKIDAVEDFIGGIGWKVLQLCVQFMGEDVVAKLLGEKHGQIWADRPDIKEFQTYYTMQIVGGTTLKPNSATKKKQAMELGQILGQYASAAPAAFLVALRVMERAFDDVVIKSDDWKLIEQSVQQGLQQGGAEGGGAGGEGGGDLEKLEQFIDGLPPPVKQALAKLLVQGAPIREAVATVAKEMQQTQQPNPGQTGASNGQTRP